MKKTLIITLEFPPDVGGVASYVSNLAEALEPSQTIVLAQNVGDTKEWDDAQQYRIVRKKLLFPKIIWPRWTRLVWHTWRLVKKENIECIMIHHALPVGYAGLFAKTVLKVPFLLFSHGTDISVGTRSPWKRALLARVCRASEQIICNSESLQHRFIRSLPEFENKTMVVYPCPDPVFLNQPDEALLEELRNTYALHGKQVLLTVSRFVDGKGFPHLLRMMPEILKSVPHLVWILIGDGPKKDYILEEIQKKNLQNIVRYLGNVKHHELKKFYDLADLFVLLTHPDEGREEGLGLVFLEAAAAGLPVVAGKSGGVEEAVLDGQTGIVTDLYKGDPAVVSAIVEAFRNKAYAITLGRTAKERIQQDFVWEKQVRLLEPWIGGQGTKNNKEETNFLA